MNIAEHSGYYWIMQSDGIIHKYSKSPPSYRAICGYQFRAHERAIPYSVIFLPDRKFCPICAKPEQK